MRGPRKEGNLQMISKIQEFIYAKLLESGKTNPWVVCKALAFGLWAMLTKPGVFTIGEEKIANFVPNGAFRVLLGGLLMIFVGFGLLLGGLLSSLFIILCLLVCPLAAIFISSMAWVSRKWQWRKLEQRVNAAMKATKGPDDAA
jgi:hypothetical protein